jgi:sortase A
MSNPKSTYTAIAERPASLRYLAGLAAALITFGVGMLVYPLTTDLYAARAQRRLRQEFAAREREVPVARPGPAPAPAGGGLVLIRIPKVSLDSVVVEGTDPQTLRAGPGRYRLSAEPCGSGNVAIAGHRTTYGHPFGRLDELRAGDEIVLVTPSAHCSYQVVAGPPGASAASPGSAAWITGPNDWSTVSAMRGSFLTLTTCNPRGSAAQRLIVRAQLENGA